MRYLSSLPLRARSSSPASRPTDPLAIQQRAQPSTCVLSLASVTVSMQASPMTTAAAASSTGSVAMDMDMDVDPFAVNVPLADVSSSTAGGIPFPSSKRTHSLLRSMPSAPRDALDYEEEGAVTTPEEPSSPPDPDFSPPRKRTRTSALSAPSSSSRSRAQRGGSSPSRVTVASVHLSGCAMASAPSSPPSCISLMSMKSSSSTAPPSTWSRRRMMPGEMRVLLYLYRTLMYGLEVRRQSLLAACGIERREASLPEVKATAVPSLEDSVSEKSSLDGQEALLAQHLKAHLLANGAAAYMLAVNPDSVAQEGRQKPCDAPSELEIDSIEMLVDVDVEDDSIDTPEPSVPFLHPHIHPSTTHTVLSYQQLVATLYIRQTLYPRRPSTKLSPKRSRPRRPGSKLSQSVSLD